MVNDEEKLRELFDIKKSSDFDKSIKKAKRLSIIRGALTSIMVFTIVGFIILLFNAVTLNKLGSEKESELKNYFFVAKPNSYIGTTQLDDRFFTGELNYVEYRFLGNKPIVDGTYKESYSYVPLINGIYGDIGNYLFSSSAESLQELQEVKKYNKVGREMMKFYHPSVKYDKYVDDLASIDNISKDKVLEISLSFDKKYSIDEVKNMIPAGITLNWYWVDTFNNNDVKNMSAHTETIKGKVNNYTSILDEYEVYGIKALNYQGEKIANPEDDFIRAVTNGKMKKRGYQYLYQDIFKTLSKDKEEITKNDIKIIGVVVSGDVNSLKLLKDKSFIKASTIGAVADKY